MKITLKTKKIFRILLCGLVFILLFSAFSNVLSKEDLQIYFFYGKGCPHCADEKDFLEKIENKYSEVKINSYDVANPNNLDLLKELTKAHNAEKYIGLVPLTFVGEKDFFLGFDSAGNTGEKIESSIRDQLGKSKKPDHKTTNDKVSLPIIGEVDLNKYSLPAQAVILGFFDGFNVCSLGALIIILGLVLILKSRAKILLYGGIFIITTGVVYGILIVLWYQLFNLLNYFLGTIRILVGVLGIFGGIYFLREFIKFKKYGPTCDISQGNGVVAKFSSKIKKSFKESGGIFGTIISVLMFAIIITIVEFPCSAVIPVFFASTLAQAQLPALTYLLYIAIFVFFYMLDEIIIFLIALFTMTIKLASNKTMAWITLLEAIVLFGLAFYYLIGF